MGNIENKRKYDVIGFHIDQKFTRIKQELTIIHLQQLIHIQHILENKDTHALKNHIKKIATSLYKEGVINAIDYYDFLK